VSSTNEFVSETVLLLSALTLALFRRLEPLVLGPARAGRLTKPVLIIAITDGTPAGEPKDHIVRVIANADNELKRSRYGSDAVSCESPASFSTILFRFPN
jgi:hypothetical protein